MSEAFSPFGTDLFGEVIKPAPKAPIVDRFLFPPFSILNAREGDWQERKRAWIECGIKSELGRGSQLIPNGMENGSKARYDVAAPGGSAMPSTSYSKDRCRGTGTGTAIAGSEVKAVKSGELATSNSSQARLTALMKTGSSKIADARTEGSGGPADLARDFKRKEKLEAMTPEQRAAFKASEPGGGGGGGPNSAYLSTADEGGTGTSIFDPVLTEINYRWFCPKGGQIIDPFSGGSVRGIVSHLVGMKYWGCDLRQEQVDANRVQGEAICPGNEPVWVCGDSITEAKNAPHADFLFTCPPYGDLEVYSDDPKDLSTMPWDDFVEAYQEIIARSCERLKPNRFASIVVGDFRDEKGFYRDFVSTTIHAFKLAGLQLYNEAILITAVGSLPIRITRQFEGGRKLGKTHQNMLVFCKGDWKAATEAIRASHSTGAEAVTVPEQAETAPQPEAAPRTTPVASKTAEAEKPKEPAIKGDLDQKFVDYWKNRKL